MELGTPHSAKKARARTRGSRQSEEMVTHFPATTAASTPGLKANPSTPGVRSNLHNTPRSALLSRFGDSCDTPQRDQTPSRYPHMSGARSHVNSPSTLRSPAAHLNSSSSAALLSPSGRKPTSAESKSPVDGRIAKVFKSLPFSGNFQLSDRIGEGTFSTVYLAKRKDSDTKIALKHLVPTSKPSRIVMETDCMREAAGHKNVISLLGMWRVGGDVVLAMPYIKHSRFSELIYVMNLAEIQEYIGNLIAALRHIHKLGIIHRDIKPSNFLYDRCSRKYSLVDFGLAQHLSDLVPGTQYTDRGSKRKLEGLVAGISKKQRVHNDIENNLGVKKVVDNTVEEICNRGVLKDAENRLKSPKCRILRDYKSLRRSPRKLYSPDEGQDVLSPSPNRSPKKRLRLQQTTPKKESPATPPVRQSPRKHSLTRPAGFSTFTITANSILNCPTPSPSLSRTPSFTMLEPNSYTGNSQATDTLNCRTPLQRASITSACSSVSTLLKPSRTQASAHCACSGKPKLCATCLHLPHMHAPRAGTPGFRPPEVLLKHPNQTTSIDMWAVGVILISILSRSYPFFRAPDDMTALAELCVLLGSAQVKDVARTYGRKLLVSVETDPQDLEKMCRELSCRERRDEDLSTEQLRQSHFVTREGVDLLRSLLTLDTKKRITADEALNHSYFNNRTIHS